MAGDGTDGTGDDAIGDGSTGDEIGNGATGNGATGDEIGNGATGDPAGSGADPSDRREVVVPLRLYKTVTVFATLLAVGFVLVGFVILDVATNRAQADLSEVNVGLAIVGLATIVGGAAVYAFSTRFRTAEMGNAKDEADEQSDNG